MFLSAMPRYNFLIREIKKRIKPESKILNVGIGLGFLERHLNSESFEVYSLDPSNNIVKEQKKFGIKSKVGFIGTDYKTKYNLETKIPKDAKDYLHPTNPKLIQLLT